MARQEGGGRTMRGVIVVMEDDNNNEWNLHLPPAPTRRRRTRQRCCPLRQRVDNQRLASMLGRQPNGLPQQFNCNRRWDNNNKASSDLSSHDHPSTIIESKVSLDLSPHYHPSTIIDSKVKKEEEKEEGEEDGKGDEEEGGSGGGGQRRWSNGHVGDLEGPQSLPLHYALVSNRLTGNGDGKMVVTNQQPHPHHHKGCETPQMCLELMREPT